MYKIYYQTAFGVRRYVTGVLTRQQAILFIAIHRGQYSGGLKMEKVYV